MLCSMCKPPVALHHDGPGYLLRRTVVDANQGNLITTSGVSHLCSFTKVCPEAAKVV